MDSINSASSATFVGHYDYITKGFRKTGFARERIVTLAFSRKDGAGWQLQDLVSVPKEPVSTPRQFQ
jgi:hypothetical protein